MASVAASEAFTITALLFAFLLVLILLRYYLPLRSTPSFLLVPVFLALALPFTIVLLVPIDLASSLEEEDGAPTGIRLPEGVMLVAWRISYWLTFCLTWFILPLLGEYVDSGYRAPQDKIIYSLKSNIRYYLIVLACLILGLVYIIMQNGFSGESLKSLLMALAYLIGLIQAIYLMGHGLVTIPRNLFRYANPTKRLKGIQSRAPKAHEKMEDAILELAELDSQVKELQTRKSGVSRDHQEWIEELVDLNPPAYNHLSSTAPPTSARVPAVITDRYLADLGRRVARARHKRLRFVAEWDYLVQSSADTQAIIDSYASHRLDFGRSSKTLLTRLSPLNPRLRYHLHAHVQPVLRIAFSVFFACASAAIVWSEVFKSFAPSISVVSRTIIPHPDSPRISFFRQFTAFIWLLYMCAAVLSSLPTIKVWGNRALVKRHTYGESACWYAGQTAKLTVPLTYNFLTFMPAKAHEQTTFYKFLGNYINLTPLGLWFNKLFPVFLLLPVLAALFNLYGRASRYFGSWGSEYFAIPDSEESDDPAALYGTVGWREGRALIERELLGRQSLDTDTPLNTDPHSSQPRARSTPSLYIPPSTTSRSNNPSPSRDQTQASRLSAATRAAREREREDGVGDDDNPFADFAHRVRNTFEGVETPEWMQELGKRPKWMGGDGNSSSGPAASTSGESSGDSGVFGGGLNLNRWFGRGGEGGVRL